MWPRCALFTCKRAFTSRRVITSKRLTTWKRVTTWKRFRGSGDVDIPEKREQQIIAIPEAIEVEGLADRHQAVEAAAVEAGGKSGELSAVEAEIGERLIAARDKGEQFVERRDAVLKQQASSAMLACELVVAIQAEHGELAEVLIGRRSALHGFGAGEGEARHARGGRSLILLPDGMLLEKI